MVDTIKVGSVVRWSRNYWDSDSTAVVMNIQENFNGSGLRVATIYYDPFEGYRTAQITDLQLVK